MAWVLWLLGYPDQALTAEPRRRSPSPGAVARLQPGACPVRVTTLHKLRGEANAAQERAEAALAIMTEQGFGQTRERQRSRGAGRWRRKGSTRRGIAQMRQGLAARQAKGQG